MSAPDTTLIPESRREYEHNYHLITCYDIMLCMYLHTGERKKGEVLLYLRVKCGEFANTFGAWYRNTRTIMTMGGRGGGSPQ